MFNPSQGQSCPVMERKMTNLAAFTHKPKGHLDGVYFHPINTKALWDKVWAEARKQDWFPADEKSIGYVGNKDGYFYFQISGLKTGFARIKV
jgi:hypothetical protein